MDTVATDILDEQALFKRIAAGDEAAFRLFFHKYNARLLPFVVSLVKSEPDAREVMQETFLKCWLQRETLTSIENPGGWIRIVMANTAYDFLRSQARYEVYISRMPMPEDAADATDDVDARSTKALIDEAVSRLPERRRQVFQLARIEGYSRKEIAEKLDISEHTVRNQLADAISFVQDYLQKHSSLYIPAVLILGVNF